MFIELFWEKQRGTYPYLMEYHLLAYLQDSRNTLFREFVPTKKTHGKDSLGSGGRWDLGVLCQLHKGRDFCLFNALLVAGTE